MIQLRPATKEDLDLLYHWANDPHVRAMSFNSDFIPYNHHEKWFLGKLSDPQCHLFIASDNHQPIGQIRFDAADTEVLIDISIESSARKRGYGKMILIQGCELIQRLGHFEKLTAWVKKSNLSSQQLFQKSGFSFCQSNSFDGVLRYEKKLD